MLVDGRTFWISCRAPVLGEQLINLYFVANILNKIFHLFDGFVYKMSEIMICFYLVKFLVVVVDGGVGQARSIHVVHRRNFFGF